MVYSLGMIVVVYFYFLIFFTTFTSSYLSHKKSLIVDVVASFSQNVYFSFRIWILLYEESAFECTLNCIFRRKLFDSFDGIRQRDPSSPCLTLAPTMVLVNRREYFQINHIHIPSPPASRPDATNDLSFPFGNINGLDRDDLRMTAYEIFFTACRSSPGFGGRNSVTLYPFENGENRPGSPGSPSSPRSPRNGVGMAVMSRTKRALGLRMSRRNPSSRRSNSWGSNPLSPSGYNSTTSPRGPFSTLPSRGTTRRPLTSAEIMRQQMKVTEGSDQRLRKTLMRTLVGQVISICFNYYSTDSINVL